MLADIFRDLNLTVLGHSTTPWPHSEELKIHTCPLTAKYKYTRPSPPSCLLSHTAVTFPIPLSSPYAIILSKDNVGYHPSDLALRLRSAYCFPEIDAFDYKK